MPPLSPAFRQMPPAPLSIFTPFSISFLRYFSPFRHHSIAELFSFFRRFQLFMMLILMSAAAAHAPLDLMLFFFPLSYAIRRFYAIDAAAIFAITSFSPLLLMAPLPPFFAITLIFHYSLFHYFADISLCRFFSAAAITLCALMPITCCLRQRHDAISPPAHFAITPCH
jgi:hypothetical protein